MHTEPEFIYLSPKKSFCATFIKKKKNQNCHNKYKDTSFCFISSGAGGESTTRSMSYGRIEEEQAAAAVMDIANQNLANNNLEIIRKITAILDDQMETNMKQTKGIYLSELKDVNLDSDVKRKKIIVIIWYEPFWYAYVYYPTRKGYWV